MIEAVVTKLADHVVKSKSNPINPYLFRLYHHREVLLSDEIVTFNIGSEILKYGLTNKLEPGNPKSDEEENPKEEPPETQSTRQKSTNPGS